MIVPSLSSQPKPPLFKDPLSFSPIRSGSRLGSLGSQNIAETIGVVQDFGPLHKEQQQATSHESSLRSTCSGEVSDAFYSATASASSHSHNSSLPLPFYPHLLTRPRTSRRLLSSTTALLSLNTTFSFAPQQLSRTTPPRWIYPTVLIMMENEEEPDSARHSDAREKYQLSSRIRSTARRRCIRYWNAT